MPFLVMQNWSKWPKGAVISGGEIMEYVPDAAKGLGWTIPTEAECSKLGIKSGERHVTEDRITELVKRGILKGIGDDAVTQPDAPVILQPTFEDRQKANAAFDIDLTESAAQRRALDLYQAREKQLREGHSCNS